jgi:lysophospholipase
MIMIIKGLSTKLPLFLYGHGSGATIVLSFLLKHDITVAGYILSAPMLQLEAIENTSYGRLKVWILSWVGEFFKDFVVNNLENPTALTRNSFQIKKHLDDRISVPFVGIRFLRELILAFRAIQSGISKYARA